MYMCIKNIKYMTYQAHKCGHLYHHLSYLNLNPNYFQYIMEKKYIECCKKTKIQWLTNFKNN